MANEERADFNHDRRFYALVLLATFASLRWGEAVALRRSDLDLNAGAVRVLAAYVERSTGELLLGPPKSRGADKAITTAIDGHVQAERHRGEDDDGAAGVLVPAG